MTWGRKRRKGCSLLLRGSILCEGVSGSSHENLALSTMKSKWQAGQCMGRTPCDSMAEDAASGSLHSAQYILVGTRSPRRSGRDDSSSVDLHPAILRPFGVDRDPSPSASSGSGFRTKLLPSSIQPGNPEGVGDPAHIAETDGLHPGQHLLWRRKFLD